jgi:hypothetical protein
MTKFDFNGDWDTVFSLDRFTKLNSDRFFEYSKDAKQKLIQGLANIKIFDPLDNNPDPTEEQFAAIHFIQENEDTLLFKIYERVKNVVYPFMKTLIDDEESWFPKLESPDELKNVLGLTSLEILQYSKESSAYFAINFYSSWDTEHGFHVLFHKDRIIGTGEAFDFDIKKVCEDCGLDFDLEVHKFNRWDNDIFDYITPHPKYGKLKPNQIRANETLPYRLIRKGHLEKFYNYIKNGLIDINYGAHGHSLIGIAIQEQNIDLIYFLIQKNVRNFNNVPYALDHCKNPEIKKIVEEYCFKSDD